MLKEGERLDRVNEALSLIQKENGLTFGTDAYLLYAYLKKRPSQTLADLGAGTGILSLLALAGGKGSAAKAIEVQDEFVELIERNAVLNRLEEKLSVYARDVRRITAREIGGEVDAVLCNPPYMAKDAGFRNEQDMKYIARHEVLGGIYDFASAASRLLKFGGSFYVVFRADRMSDLFDAMRRADIEPKRLTVVYGKQDSAPTLILCEGKKGGSMGLYVTPPLILKTEDGKDSETLTAIYEKGEFSKRYETA